MCSYRETEVAELVGVCLHHIACQVRATCWSVHHHLRGLHWYLDWSLIIINSIVDLCKTVVECVFVCLFGRDDPSRDTYLLNSDIFWKCVLWGLWPFEKDWKFACSCFSRSCSPVQSRIPIKESGLDSIIMRVSITIFNRFIWYRPIHKTAGSLYSNGSGHRPCYGTQWISHHFILLPAVSALIKRCLSLRTGGQVILPQKGQCMGFSRKEQEKKCFCDACC